MRSNLTNPQEGGEKDTEPGNETGWLGATKAEHPTTNNRNKKTGKRTQGREDPGRAYVWQTCTTYVAFYHIEQAN